MKGWNQSTRGGGVLQEHEPGFDELCTAEMIPIPIVPSKEPQLCADRPSLSIDR